MKPPRLSSGFAGTNVLLACCRHKSNWTSSLPDSWSCRSNSSRINSGYKLRQTLVVLPRLSTMLCDLVRRLGSRSPVSRHGSLARSFNRSGPVSSRSSSPRSQKVCYLTLTVQFNCLSTLIPAGKKTFGSLFSKVKAKIQEFETGKPVNASSSTPSVQQQQWTPPPQPAQQQAAYYDPNPAPRQVASPIQTPGVTPPPTQGVQGYDVSGCKYPHFIHFCKTMLTLSC